MNRARIASLQYFVRPIRDFSEFRDQVTGLVQTAADYDCDLLVFPEYFTVQLLTLGDVRRPMEEQIRSLSRRVPDYIELFEHLSRAFGIQPHAERLSVLACRDRGEKVFASYS